MSTTLEFFAGDDVILNVTITDAATGQPVDITSVDIDFLLKLPDVDIAKSVGSGITVTDGPAGQCAITIDAADTSTVMDSGSRSEYEIQITDGGSISTVKLDYLAIKRNII